MNVFDSLLNQVRNLTVSISFLHITSKPPFVLKPPHSPSPEPAEKAVSFDYEDTETDEFCKGNCRCPDSAPQHCSPLTRHALVPLYHMQSNCFYPKMSALSDVPEVESVSTQVYIVL